MKMLTFFIVLLGFNSIYATETSQLDFGQNIRSIAQKVFTRYEQECATIEKDYILTRTLQMYLNYKKFIPKTAAINNLINDIHLLRTYLYKKSWGKHDRVLLRIRTELEHL